MERLVDRFTPALEPDFFDRFSFFELYPFDGGGSFINHEIIGSVDDAEYTDAVIRKGALDEFGGYGKIDFRKFDFWRTIERCSWIDRMYFIAPMANHARKTHDRKLGRQVLDILLRFAGTPEYRAPETQQAVCALYDEVLRRRDQEYNALGPEFNAPVSYMWFDFQPASRILHAVHAMWFLRDMDLLSEEENRILEDLIFIHGQNIFWGECSHIPLRPGNHQALRGTALMTACAFFRGSRGTDAWIPVAERLCDYHIRNDFLRDGMLNDLSPSYHFFESWIARDALKIADREGYHLSAEARAKAQKAFEVCRAMRQPDGFSTVISDGYPLDMSIFIQSLGSETEKDELEILLDESKIALKKDRAGNYLLFDCSPLLTKLSHFHGGKQAVTVFFEGKEFLADPGCCSYDDEDFSLYFKQSHSHSSLLVDGHGDSVLQGLYTWLSAPVCRISPWRDGVISSVMNSDAPGWEGVEWNRTVDFRSGRLEITDQITSDSGHEYTFLFALGSGVECHVDGRKAQLTCGGVHVEALFDHPAEVREGQVFKDFAKRPAKHLVVRLEAESCTLKTVFICKHSNGR